MCANTVVELWRKSLCHMNQKGTHMVAERELLLEMKSVHLEKCTKCLADKQNRAAFRPRPLMQRKTILELVTLMYAM